MMTKIEKQNTNGAISMVAAMARNRIIGSGNRIPWRLPADMAHFRRTTMGHSILMGRKTFESIGKALDGRRNIVLTSNRQYKAEGCDIVHSVEEALERYGNEELYVIGGAEIYRLFMPYADKLFMTEIDQDFEGDASFPEIDLEEWAVTGCREGEMDEKNKYPHRFVVYERRR